MSSGGQLPKGTEFTINAQGMEGSVRKAKDGFTYFGCNPAGAEPDTVSARMYNTGG